MSYGVMDSAPALESKGSKIETHVSPFFFFFSLLSYFHIFIENATCKGVKISNSTITTYAEPKICANLDTQTHRLKQR